MSLGFGYSHDEGGGGGSRAHTIHAATNVTTKIYEVCTEIFKQNYRGRSVRNVHVSIFPFLY
ncbi:DinB/UmuC family translesion DNA polymerase [Paenibacillus caseinilyticus]|uniref:DinB/UmuC family translesion DNA polymerase n=1 Tax=Paenibacillus mucilaginosus TaxID=61624 RepID=UPI000FFEE1A5